MTKCAHPPCEDEALPKSKYHMCARHRERERKGQTLFKHCAHCGAYFECPNVGGKRLYCVDCCPPGDRRAIYTLNRYGITSSMFDSMYFEQNGQCAFSNCDKEATSIDHWHGCQEPHGNAVACARCVRALLCQGCNVRLATVEDPIYRNAAFEYLAEYGGV